MEARESVMSNDFIDQKTIADMLSIKPKSIYYIMESDNTFPKPLVLSPRIKRWKKAEVVAWIDSKLEK